MTNGAGAGDGEPLRNVILAIVISILIFVPYQFFVLGPMQQKERAARAAQVQTQQVQKAEAAKVAAAAAASPVATAARIPFDTQNIDGSLSLAGGRLDTLSLKQYRQTTNPNSPEVQLLRPPENAADPGATYGSFGWLDASGAEVPIVWTAPADAKLTPETPVTLTFETGDGLKIERTVAVDDRYMFTITDKVTNESDIVRYLSPFAAVRRHGKPGDLINYMTLHEGFVGVVDNNGKPNLYETDYKEALKGSGQNAEVLARGVPTVGGWLGITDKYWLSAVVPDQGQQVTGRYTAETLASGVDVYSANYVSDVKTIAANGEVLVTHRFFSGPKRVQILQSYEKSLGIADFDKAVDWGNFYFLTRPFFAIIEFFFNIVKNFGVAIMLTTVVVKLALFPIAYNSYKTMSKIQKLQPKIKELQERFPGDQQRIQQEMMRLYQAEKVNVASGCLPILLQIPIFYALYKVLLVTIEMRHQPFFGYIKDLAAPDPTSWVNLFGLLPFAAPTSLPIIGPFLFAVGVLPILYGVSMWGVTALNPQQATDPMQRRIFQLMPIIFTFMFAAFPVGMVIYWTWSNVLTMIQQYIIMRRQGVVTGFDKWLARTLKRAPPTPAQ